MLEIVASYHCTEFQGKWFKPIDPKIEPLVFFFFKNLASSVTRYHGQLSCKISEKTNDLILIKFSDGRTSGRTDRQTDGRKRVYQRTLRQTDRRTDERECIKGRWRRASKEAYSVIIYSNWLSAKNLGMQYLNCPRDKHVIFSSSKLTNWMVKSKLPPRSGCSLVAVEPHP